MLILSWLLCGECQSVIMCAFDETWTCHLQVISVSPTLLSYNPLVLYKCSQQLFPSSTAFPPSFISASLYIFPPTRTLYFPLYVSICVFSMSLLWIPKSPRFYSILFSLLLFSSVCLFGRLPCNQREPASCVLYCHKRPIINRGNRISRSDTVIFNQSLAVVVHMQITCVPSWTVSIQQ